MLPVVPDAGPGADGLLQDTFVISGVVGEDRDDEIGILVDPRLQIGVDRCRDVHWSSRSETPSRMAAMTRRPVGPTHPHCERCAWARSPHFAALALTAEMLN